MNERTESATVENVAESISRGERVDWEQVDRDTVDSPDSHLLHGLQLIERIATFHRAADPVSMFTDLSEKAVPCAEPPSLVEPALGTWGHLTLIETIGEGAFAVVYRARDERLQSDVALKLLKPSASNPSRALAEARLLARLRHPNVVKVYGADLIDGRVGVWMELIKGFTLAEILRTQGPFSASEAKIVGLDLCRALAAVHRAGLIHGDVKAHNVMREEGGRTVLMDFGTGKDLTAASPAGRWGNDFAGTPVYLPPEIFEGSKRSETTDIYSLGVLLYHLVTDSYPVQGSSRDEIQQAHRRRERRHLRDLRPDLPGDFIQTVERAIEFEPRQRHLSAGAFETALQHRLPDPSPHRWVRRLVWTGAIAGTVLLAGVTYKVMMGGLQPAPSGAAGSPMRAEHTLSAPASALVNTPADYQIQTVFYRAVQGGPRAALRPGQQIAPGDEIYAEVLASSATYVYIINEDEQGESNLLFPLAGQSVTNPLPAGETSRLPNPYRWQVDKAGGREHFIVLASPTRLSEFEQTIFASLPRPEINKPVLSARLSDKAKGVLRSVGGLTASPDPRPQVTGPLVKLFRAEPLRSIKETAHGLWIRELTLENPVK